MKKRYLILAGLLAVTVMAAAGCGKEKEDKAVQQQVQATPTQAPEPTKEAELVDMQVTKEKNVIGKKSETASKVTIINKTGDDVGDIYIRQHPSDDEDDEDDWGEELINGAFTLKNGDQAVYYFDKPSSSGITYDIRITYTDEDKNECFFRDLPLATMKQITLRMNGTGEDSFPYATYMTSTGTKEFSTLNEVKKRLGLIDDDSDEDENSEDTETTEPTETPDPTAEPEPTQAPAPTETPDDGSGDTSTPTDDTIDAAEGYIGQSMDALIGSLGSPQYDEYEEEPDTGKTGYHYYSNFTVSTTIDENGNEIVTGIW